MRLLDAVIMLNGAMLGDVKIAAPLDAEGNVRLPTAGDDIVVAIRTTKTEWVLSGPTKLRTA